MPLSSGMFSLLVAFLFLFGQCPRSLALDPSPSPFVSPSFSTSPIVPPFSQGASLKPPQGTPPLPSNSPAFQNAPSPQKTNAKSTPLEMLQKFFEGVQAGHVEDATIALTRGSLIVEKQENIDALKKGTQEAVDKYGDITGFEVLEKKAVGDHLLRVIAISLGEEMPLRWKFFFYKSKGCWFLLDMRVDSGIADLFDDTRK